MKKVWLVLSIVMAFMLLFACTAEKAISPEQETPPPTENKPSATDQNAPPSTVEKPPLTEPDDPPAAEEPINWIDNVPDSPYNTFTISRDSETWGYVLGTNGEVDKDTDTLSYTFYKKTIADRLYYLLKQTEAEEPDGLLYGFDFNIKFSAPDGQSEILECIYKYDSMYLWHLGIKDTDDNVKWMPWSTERYFRKQCSNRGMTDDNFFFSARTVYPRAFSDGPALLRDIEKQLTPEQAAEKLAFKVFSALEEPTPGRAYYVKEIKDIGVKIIDRAQIEDLGFLRLPRENQWFVDINDDGILYEGLCDGGVPQQMWSLEYEAGWWRMYTWEMIFSQDRPQE